MCNGTIAGTIYAQDGTILWHGRDVRYATPEQYSALVARDRCCTICAADASECEAHHVIAWTAPLQGETNIANLALVCTDCHHHIHNNNLTMYRQHGMWKLRPATPTETPRNHHHTHK